MPSSLLRSGRGCLLLAMALAACSSGSSGHGASGPGASGTVVLFDASADFTSPAHFFDFPWPSDLRLTAAGTPDLTGIANPTLSDVFAGLLAIAQQRSGFPVVPVAWFDFTTDLAPRVVTDVIDAAPASPILLVDVDPTSSTLGKLYPVVSETIPQDTYVPDGILAVGPRPGVVLQPKHQYAYVVLTSAMDVNGATLGVAPALQQALTSTDSTGSGREPLRGRAARAPGGGRRRHGGGRGHRVHDGRRRRGPVGSLDEGPRRLPARRHRRRRRSRHPRHERPLLRAAGDDHVSPVPGGLGAVRHGRSLRVRRERHAHRAGHAGRAHHDHAAQADHAGGRLPARRLFPRHRWAEPRDSRPRPVATGDGHRELPARPRRGLLHPRDLERHDRLLHAPARPRIRAGAARHRHGGERPRREPAAMARGTGQQPARIPQHQQRGRHPRHLPAGRHRAAPLPRRARAPHHPAQRRRRVHGPGAARGRDGVPLQQLRHPRAGAVDGRDVREHVQRRRAARARRWFPRAPAATGATSSWRRSSSPT